MSDTTINYSIEEQKKAFEYNFELSVKTLAQITKIINTAIAREAFSENDLQNSVKISIETIAQFMKIIDLASSRGTFQASELSHVGKVYDLLAQGLTNALNIARAELHDPEQSQHILMRKPPQEQQTPLQVPMPINNPMQLVVRDSVRANDRQELKQTNVDRNQDNDNRNNEVRDIQIQEEAAKFPTEFELED